ncbi:uncharacterized protein BXZ73DRAFT_47185, partial [Epithele typhae]|uniref:uncharacterized protein n=1 Tax=Epithele typhae TaxID=378194 RepID=UPI002008867A
ALNKTTGNKMRCPGLVFECSQEHPSLICCYTDENSELVKQQPPSSRAELGYVEMFIQVNSNPSHDMFVDPPQKPFGRSMGTNVHGTIDDLSLRHRLHGKHSAFVSEVFTRQHRTCLYTVILSGSSARMYRWDREGCVLSESVDVHESPAALCDFLWLFSHASPSRRGFDTTVERASQQEEILFRNVVTQHVQLQLDLAGQDLEQAVSEHYQPGNVIVLPVVGHPKPVDASNTRRFIVSRPVLGSTRWHSRGTRGYWAVDTVTRRIAFLKDTWRILFPGSIPEGLILEQLNTGGVDHVPKLVCHSVVPDGTPIAPCILPGKRFMLRPQARLTSDWAAKAGQLVILGTRSHYRLVVDMVGYPLNHFSGTAELLHASCDAFHALRQAFTKTARLHRNIGLENIIVVREGSSPIRRGYVIGWDFSLPVTTYSPPLRSGSCTFMSRRMVRQVGLGKPHRVQDDIESLFYVVLYCAFLWLPHGASKDALEVSLRRMFDDEGPSGKEENLIDRRYTNGFGWSPPLREWVDTMSHYMGPCPPMADGTSEDKWSDPEHLDVFWRELLDKYHGVLPSGDRVEHDNPRGNKLTKKLKCRHGASSGSDSHPQPPKRRPTVPDVDGSTGERPHKRPRY